MEPLFDDHYCLVARRDHPELKRRVNAVQHARLEHVQVSVSAEFRAPDFLAGAPVDALRRSVAAVPRFSIRLRSWPRATP